MHAMTFALRWSWVLGIALFCPVALPAGGGERYKLEIRRLTPVNSLLTGDCWVLKAGPYPLAPSLRTLQLGTPLRVLRIWHGAHGEEWLQVQITSNEIVELTSVVRRGWINV